jgi:phthiocerol/phenolphthiocerol synthesis type-I polyketide synthase B
VTEKLTPEAARRFVLGYVAHLLNIPEARVDLNRSLSDYGLDSMDAVVMAGAMEEHFGGEIDPAVFLHASTLDEQLAELERKL